MPVDGPAWQSFVSDSVLQSGRDARGAPVGVAALAAVKFSGTRLLRTVRTAPGAAAAATPWPTGYCPAEIQAAAAAGGLVQPDGPCSRIWLGIPLSLSTGPENKTVGRMEANDDR